MVVYENGSGRRCYQPYDKVGATLVSGQAVNGVKPAVGMITLVTNLQLIVNGFHIRHFSHELDCMLYLRLVAYLAGQRYFTIARVNENLLA
jgi:hypothetical protein